MPDQVAPALSGHVLARELVVHRDGPLGPGAPGMLEFRGFQDLGFKFGSGFRVQGSGFRVWVWGLGFRFQV